MQGAAEPAIEFETPENVTVHYDPAGLGTRFIAWITDQLLLMIILFLLFVAMLILAAAGSVLTEELFAKLEGPDDETAIFYVLGVFYVIFGLGSFFYYGLCELLMKGQTPGKRMAKIRVAKEGGFRLDGGAILVRSLFRLIDHLPPLWIVPLLNPKGQRFGDMVAGTVVVADQAKVDPAEVALREWLLARPLAELRWRFDGGQLARLTPEDHHAITRFLLRWNGLNDYDRHQFLLTIVPPLAHRLGVGLPDPMEARQFLEEILAAEFRRQYRNLH